MRTRTFQHMIIGILACLIITSAAWADLPAADRLYAEKSYAMAAVEYATLLDSGLSAKELPEVRAKWADCVLKGKDPAQTEDAVKILKELIDSEDHGRWWAEANESLALHYLETNRWSFPNEIKQDREAAGDYWGGSSEVELARRRFIDVSFTLGDFATSYWGWASPPITPLRLDAKSIQTEAQPNQGLVVLYEEILKVAKSDEDKAKSHYSLAMANAQNYYVDANKKKDEATKHFNAVIQDFPLSEWVDDAYYQFAVSHENQQDYVKALELYREFQKHFRKGDSQWFDDIERRVKDIAEPKAQIAISNTFVPGSEVRLSLNWRNLKQAQMTFYKIDLTKELNLFTDAQWKPQGFQQYQELLKYIVEDSGRLNLLPVALSFEAELKDEGKHLMYSETKGLAEWRRQKDSDELEPQTGILAPGAYI